MNEPPKIFAEAKYLEYTDTIKTIGIQRIQERYEALFAAALSFIKGMGYQGHVSCDVDLLMFAILGCYSDLTRLKDFHKIENTNEIKIHAYETSWLIKRRPLQIIDGNDQKLCFCNEQFAYSQIVFWCIKAEQDENKESLFFSKDMKFFLNTLFYHFKYRDCDPQVLEFALTSFVAGRKYQSLLSQKDSKAKTPPDLL